MKKRIGMVLLAVAAACQAVAPETSEPMRSPVAANRVASGEQHVPDLAFMQAACGDCHGLARDELSPNPAAPAFSEIANRPGLSAETLSNWLRDAHNYPEAMDFELTDARAEALTAHILALRDQTYKPPIY
ncbi:MAG: hypothetical protein N2423_04300 [Novosphingobium sp.]|nr:hypothetical protein [Novosphingobium sp.]